MKRMIALLLCVIALLPLCACSSGLKAAEPTSYEGKLTK